ncbi:MULTISPECIES: S9 family peptidase [unclassified Mycobacterium]|uniref:S9 family peptidase n=1 Tax=unclassified Mycobacterium TaxID=2642494 RepID=UPI0007402E26|nr:MULTISPECIES: S9 family peptidase [unclassified Mycobacterium]KUH80415.1 peptidase S9 [Mycobacterium sp. GA-1999]KUH89105.1 peptidase S9 [Mycobacterium sp. GA-0227b]KUH95841.1 peptidase S9 [Mycobacterium sp. IS-1556]
MTATTPGATASPFSTPFDDLDEYVALPRVSGLALSPDGSRLVTTVAELDDKRTEYVSAVWELDPAGVQPARRLTRGAKGESAPAFAADGDLLFVAVRPTADDDKPPAALWRLPAAGGEAVEALSLPGGVEAVRPAREADVAVVRSPLMPSARTVEDDRRLRDLRKDNKITAILHAGYPIRHWDSDLGPAEPHLLGVELAGDPNGDHVRDLTAGPGGALRDSEFDVSSDGRFLVTTWQRPAPGASRHSVLVRIDLDSGERTVLVDELDADVWRPAVSPDGSTVVYLRETFSTPETAPRITLGCLRFGGEPAVLAADWDRWPASATWSRDGSTVIVTADQNGRSPVFRVDVADGAVTQVTFDDYCYSDVVTAPDGVMFALRSSYAAPPHPVRIDPDGAVTELPCVTLPSLPGTLSELEATADDGTRLRSWLVLPPGDGEAPLLLWIHGGPLSSWNAWSWRWNPWLLAARGYAVLLPDPGLSTGYGQRFIQRGWGAWGGAPFDDLMAATDAACAHPRIDADRTAAMGGSFGGYMANWVAGHTDRFDAIVTHASLWALDQFGATTDSSYYWLREMTREMAQNNSPHHHVEEIRTPMLVIHGDKDYRVPIGEALRLWYELLTHSALPADDDGDSPHRFLYFPSENHWVLTPQHAKIWYQVVTGFLARHVLGEDVEVPETLG